ncbi:MAG TPA: protein kinase [Acidimicrobiales bacterium]|nr:protein kinase [Acidimicrobiales bacterium]
MGSPPPDLGAPGAARPGTLLAGRYRLERPLASGGMARVWVARDEVLGRPVAVKVLHEHLAQDSSFVARFRAEALAAARLGHSAVVSVYDTCSEDGLEAIVMELVDGTTLRDRLDQEGRLAPAEAARIAARIAQALTVAHAAGIVHRDIKPANVLLAVGGRVVVTDFGIAKATETGDITTGRQMLGTAKYLAPEQVEGTRVDGRADVYALGVVLFEMVCGRVPFHADTEAGTALARLHHDPPAPRSLRPDLEPSYEQVVLRALARRPEDRWADATTLGRALAALAAGRAAVVPASPAGDRAPGGPPAHDWRSPEPPTASPPAPSPPSQSPAPSGPSPTGHAPAPVPARAARPRRTVRSALLLGVVVVAVVVAGALAWQVVGPSDEAAELAGATTFDPFGTGPPGENDGDVGLAVDGDPATAWHTERYRDPDITVRKPGVGLLLDLGTSRTAEALALTSPSSGWTAEAYVLDDRPGADVTTWGEALGRSEGIDGDIRLDLGGTGGRYVLLWITRASEDGTVQVAEAVVTVRS